MYFNPYSISDMALKHKTEPAQMNWLSVYSLKVLTEDLSVSAN